ncbi:MAG: DUF5004 domain-containing protein [Prolixibacteraceae bacterium]|nr:DUF5004 domain-containing protein [Prolixibacteraceae bacterium]
MKQKLLIWAGFMLIFVTGCYKTDDGTYTEPITIYEKMGGQWGLTKITQVDEIAVAGSIKPDVMVLTNQFNFKTFVITFEVDEQYQPTTFMVEGSAPELFLKNGYWSLSEDFPTTDGNPVVIQLFADEARTTVMDELNIMSLPGTRATMEFNLSRISNNLPYVTYQYALKQLN